MATEPCCERRGSGRCRAMLSHIVPPLVHAIRARNEWPPRPCCERCGSSICRPLWPHTVQPPAHTRRASSGWQPWPSCENCSSGRCTAMSSRIVLNTISACEVITHTSTIGACEIGQQRMAAAFLREIRRWLLQDDQITVATARYLFIHSVSMLASEWSHPLATSPSSEHTSASACLRVFHTCWQALPTDSYIPQARGGTGRLQDVVVVRGGCASTPSAVTEAVCDLFGTFTTTSGQKELCNSVVLSGVCWAGGCNYRTGGPVLGRAPTMSPGVGRDTPAWPR